MADYRELAPFVKKWEGGFVNDPNDLGGATMKGVTLNTYKAFCRRKGYPVPTVERLKAIPNAHWEEIFKTMYWDKWQADNIRSQRVANALVDWLWHSGAYGIKLPQTLLGTVSDGVVGSKTLALVNAAGEGFFDVVMEERLRFLERIVKSRPQNAKFMRGWLNRLNDLRKL